jgi:PPIC-type peptidyl-prolyl cis-trans isomerase-like protein
MRARLSRLGAGRGWRKLGALAGLFGVAVLAFCWGRYGSPSTAAAAPPGAREVPPPTPPETAGDYAHRWVAVIHGNLGITREEFGEYLIARHAEQLELLVNKRIIELACKEKGVEVTAGEVDAALAEDLKGMGNISLNDFVTQVLARYHKSLLEWKEDVIRPKLAMTKLCRGRVQVTDQDLHDAFDAYYGEKVDCRLVLFPKDREKDAMLMYADLRKSDEDFNRIARSQASPSLASKGGEIQPIGHHTTGNDELEKEAFSLQPGEVSKLIGTPQGTVVLKCVKRIPPDAGKKLDKERAVLEKEIIDKKTQLEIPKLFKELQAQAKPRLFLKKYTTQEELERDVKRDLQADGLPAPAPPQKP